MPAPCSLPRTDFASRVERAEAGIREQYLDAIPDVERLHDPQEAIDRAALPSFNAGNRAAGYAAALSHILLAEVSREPVAGKALSQLFGQYTDGFA
nr:hypothetical protein [Leisingera aquimarina]